MPDLSLIMDTLPERILQSGGEKTHTDKFHCRLPGRSGNIWDVGGKTETHQRWESMGTLGTRVYLFVFPLAPSEACTRGGLSHRVLGSGPSSPGASAPAPGRARAFCSSVAKLRLLHEEEAEEGGGGSRTRRTRRTREDEEAREDEG